MTPTRPRPCTVWVAGRPVQVLVLGSGPAVVFLHGWGLAPRAYLPALQHLARCGFTVHAVALPGFGGSEALPVGQHRLPGLGAHVAAAIAALGFDRPVPVLGHSLGGGIALTVAATHPELVSGLVLICPVGGAGLTGVPSWLDLGEGMTAGLSPLVTAVTLREFLPAMARNPLGVVISGLAARTADLADHLREVRAVGLPTAVIYAAGDRVVRPAWGDPGPGPGSGAPGSCPGTQPGVQGSVQAWTVPGNHAWLLTDPARFASETTAALASIHHLSEHPATG